MHPLRHRADGFGKRGLIDEEVRRRSPGLGGKHQQRGAALGGLGDAGERVRQPAALVYRNQAEPAADPCVRVGHRRRTRLVPGRDEPCSAGDEGVRDVEVAAADDTERRVGAEAGQRPPDGLRDCHCACQITATLPVGWPRKPGKSGAAAATAQAKSLV